VRAIALKRGGIWWVKFKFAGQVIRESTKSGNKNVARDAERARHLELENAYNGISKVDRAQMFSVAAEKWLEAKTPQLSPRTVAIETANLKHLKPFFGSMLLVDVRAENISSYQGARLKEKAAPKTINLEDVLWNS
jgi:hypothetical protein